jgi:hypothetical protein
MVSLSFLKIWQGFENGSKNLLANVGAVIRADVFSPANLVDKRVVFFDQFLPGLGVGIPNRGQMLRG